LSQSISDGHSIWTIDPTARVVTRTGQQPASTWPASTLLTHRFTKRTTLEAILQTNFHCTPGTLLEHDQIAGRPVFVIEFGEDCCHHSIRRRQQSKLLDGRMVFWIDSDTHFTL
jgi:hypothetical protein